MDRILSIGFVILSLAGAVGISMLAFPYAAMSSQTAQAAATPQEAETLEDVDLGDFGQVPVLDLMQHYVDNPPAVTEGGNDARKERFQGC